MRFRSGEGEGEGWDLPSTAMALGSTSPLLTSLSVQEMRSWHELGLSTRLGEGEGEGGGEE